jgi:hypothetical protein
MRLSLAARALGPYKVRMLRFGLTMLAAVSIVIAAGCAETPVERAKRIEPMLAAAGFHMHPADTPARQAQLKSVTPLKVRYYPHDGKLHYWFADPVYCDCIFIGDEAAYDAYQRLRLQQRMVNQEQMAAAMNEDAAQQEQMNFMMWPTDPFFY